MREFGEAVEAMEDRYGERGTKDDRWIADLGTGGIIVVTSDLGTARKKYEAALAKQHQLGVFYFPSKMSRCAQIGLLVKRWPDIKVAATASTLPFGCKILQRGELVPVFGAFKKR